MHRWLARTLLLVTQCLLGTQCTTPVAVPPTAPAAEVAGSSIAAAPVTPLAFAPAFEPPPEEGAPPVEPSVPVDVDALRAAVRRGQWTSSATLVDTLSLSGLGSDYLRAKAALELGSFTEAATRFEALVEHEELSFLAEEERRRALARSGEVTSIPTRDRLLIDPHDLLFAAEGALERGETDRAGGLIREAAKRIRGHGESAARLHELRARWAMAAGQPYRAFVDWRWLATRAPASPFAAFALEHLNEHFPDWKLGPDQWQDRIGALSEAGQPERLVQELERWRRESRQKGPSPADELHFLGWAHYRARDYDRAAQTLALAAEQSPRYATRDGYYAGQAYSRVGRQEQAIDAYRRLLEQSRKGTFAELGLLRIPREYSLDGRWPEAVAAYTEFIDGHAHSEHLETALRERAVARYANFELDRAAFEFKRLRALRPASPFASLYRHLEALSLLGTERAAEAIAVFEAVREERPLGFEGVMARLRLERLAVVSPALAAPGAAPGEVRLPPLVDELETLGLFRESERLLTRTESKLERNGEARFELECRTHERLFAGRRRLLLGLSAAARGAFYTRPAEAPRWLWDCVYPEPYGAWVDGATEEFAVPRPLVYAIMRQESGFRPAVTSPANAHGLMQIIPPTAREIARGLGESETAIDLFDPALNVRYGTYYLGMLQRTFGAHPALTAAGYNAGPEAAGLWFAAGQQLPLEMFVARIPYDETRTYVMRVLSNLAAYQLLDPELGRIDIPLALR